jgi:hypothetical protein
MIGMGSVSESGIGEELEEGTDSDTSATPLLGFGAVSEGMPISLILMDEVETGGSFNNALMMMGCGG